MSSVATVKSPFGDDETEDLQNYKKPISSHAHCSRCSSSLFLPQSIMTRISFVAIVVTAYFAVIFSAKSPFKVVLKQSTIQVKSNAYFRKCFTI